MSRGTKRTFLTLVTICMAGCVNSDFVVQPQRQEARHPVQDARIYNAREEVPPRILPETYFASGSLLEAQGLLGGAIEQFQRATAVNHNYVGAYHRLGLLLSAVGRYEEATTALRRAVVLLPDSAILHNNLGYNLMLQRAWEDAEGEFSRALELIPGFPRAHINRGMAQSKLGRFDAALASFEAVLPEAAAHYNLGLMYRGQHRFEKAVETFGHVLSINPGFTAASTQLEQLAPHFPTPPPPPPADLVADAAGPVTDEGETTLAERLPSPFAPVVWDEVGPPIEPGVSMDHATAVDPYTAFLESFPDLNAEPRVEAGAPIDADVPIDPTTVVYPFTAFLEPFPESNTEPRAEASAPVEAGVSIDSDTAVDPYTAFLESFPDLNTEPRAEASAPIEAGASIDPATAVDSYTAFLEQFPELNTEPRTVARADSPFESTFAVPDARHTKAETALETMLETIAALSELREYPVTTQDVEAELQIVRNEIDCLEDLQAQQQDEFNLDFADLVCGPEPFVVSDASIASEADFVAGAGEPDEFFEPRLSTTIAAQLTLDQLLEILYPPTATANRTMGMSIVGPVQDTIDAWLVDEPEIASPASVEEQPDPSDEEEQAPNRDHKGAAFKE